MPAIALGLVAAFCLSQGLAAQGVAYSFVTGSEPYGSPLAMHFAGQAVSGVFLYDSSVPASGVSTSPPTVGSTVYAGAITTLAGSVGAHAFLDPAGRAIVGDEKYTTPPTPADILVLAADPNRMSGSPPEEFDLVGFEIDGYTLVNVRLFWVEGLFDAPDFLADQALPAAPPAFHGRLALDFVPTGTSGPIANVFFEPVLVTLAGLQVSIDVRPGDEENWVNPRSRGVIEVAILTTGGFDALAVDPLSVLFGSSGAHETHGRGHPTDVDGDGDQDLVLHFRTAETGIQHGDQEAMLSGLTFDGQLVMGADAIRTVGWR